MKHSISWVFKINAWKNLHWFSSFQLKLLFTDMELFINEWSTVWLINANSTLGFRYGAAEERRELQCLIKLDELYTALSCNYLFEILKWCLIPKKKKINCSSKCFNQLQQVLSQHKPKQKSAVVIMVSSMHMSKFIQSNGKWTHRNILADILKRYWKKKTNPNP